jgi:hypothetical protein
MSSFEPHPAFVLEPNVAFHVRKKTVCACPNVTPAMSVSKKSNGFMVAKSALEAVDSPVRTKVQVCHRG